ncbi:MAG: Crp/Fnr family transcriptional regulator [Proteobacteria bacterium]|nr:Crp/Fnr family transcriptional regulator [Pseudomonadota bacterium]
MAVGKSSEAHSLKTFVNRLRLHSTLAERDVQALIELPWKFISRSQNTQLVRVGDLTGQCMVLVEGFVHRFRITEEGERQILTIYVPGDPINFEHLYLPLADDGLQVAKDCTLACVAQRDLHALLAAHPAIAEAVMRALLVDASIFREWTLNVGRRDARARIAHLLCEISVRLRAQGFDFQNTPIPLTQDQIADATGLTPVHVNRTLKVLSAERHVSRRGALVMLPDPEALRAVAGFDARYLHLSPWPRNDEPIA